jgi:UDP-N-acetylglucosamine 2-epimerase
VYVGANAIAGLTPERVLEKTLEMVNRPRSWPNPLGDGRAAEKIVNILREEADLARALVQGKVFLCMP